MEKNLFDVIKKCSRIDNSTEEFGLIREERTYPNNFAKGKYTALEFKTWNIQNHMIYRILDCNSEFNLNPKSKFMILNIDQRNTLSWLEPMNKKAKLLPKTGMFFNTSKSYFKLTNTEISKLVLVEFKEEYFNQSIFNDSFKKYLKNKLIINDRISFSINSKVESIIAEIFEPTKVGLCQFMNLNNTIFELLSMVLNFSNTSLEKDKIHAYHDQLEIVKKMIDANLNIQYSIDKLSKIAGLNTSYLKKYFKEAYNITLFEYAQQQRIKLAKKLLKNPKLTIAIISEKVGYQQSAHFSYAFKRNTGVSPNQYRKK